MNLTNSFSPYNNPLQYCFAPDFRSPIPTTTDSSSPFKNRHRKTYSSQFKLSDSPKKPNSNQLASTQSEANQIYLKTTLSITHETIDNSLKKSGRWDMVVDSSDDKKPFSKRMQIKTEKESNIFFEKGQSDYNKIRQQLNKKEMLINELKKLSEAKDQGRNYKELSYYEKANKQFFSPQKATSNFKNQDIINYKNNDGFKLSLSTVAARYTKQDLTKSIIQNVQSSSNSESPNQKLADAINKDKVGRQAWLDNKKNPQEVRDYFKKAKYNEYRPNMKSKQDQEGQLRLTQLRMSKISSNITYPTPNNDNVDHYLYSSCNYSHSTPISEPLSAISLKGKRTCQLQSIDLVKSIRDTMKRKSMLKGSILLSNNRKPNIFDFQISKTLGQGKFGTVYQAIHKTTNSIYAIKKIKKDIIIKHKMIDQFLQQIKIQSYCNQENILKFYGFFDDSQYIYLVLEYMESGTLYSLLKKCKTLSQHQASSYLKETASAIVFLHDRGIAHRDIKPENIVISHGVGKICDFGWAAICTDRRKTYCGTFDYAAPEIIEGSEYDMSVDLWCLGVMAYELLVGKAPFYNISRKQTMKNILNVQKETLNFPSHLSKQATSFIQGLIKRNPEQRMEGQDILTHPFLNLPQQEDS